MINWYRKRTIKNIDHHIREWLYHESRVVKPKSIQGLFNSHCFENAAQYASTHDGVKMVLCLYIEEGGNTILHFWNKDADGNHLETTLGYRVPSLTYYPIKVLSNDELQVTGAIFDEALEYYTKKLTTRWQRFILNGERII